MGGDDTAGVTGGGVLPFIGKLRLGVSPFGPLGLATGWTGGMAAVGLAGGVVGGVVTTGAVTGV